MDTEQQRRRRCADARITDSENARSKQLFWCLQSPKPTENGCQESFRVDRNVEGLASFLIWNIRHNLQWMSSAMCCALIVANVCDMYSLGFSNLPLYWHIISIWFVNSTNHSWTRMRTLMDLIWSYFSVAYSTSIPLLVLPCSSETIHVFSCTCRKRYSDIANQAVVRKVVTEAKAQDATISHSYQR